MNSNQVIELKEKDSINSTNNGDYSINLKENILLEEGDQLYIKKTFIDTVTIDSELIYLPDDVNIEMDYVVYGINYQPEQVTPYPSPPFQSSAAVVCTGWKPTDPGGTTYGGGLMPIISGERYVFCDEAKVAGSGQIVTVMYIQRLTNLPTTDTIGNGRPYQLEYNDILGVPRVLHGNLPTQKVNPAMLDLGLKFNIICQEDSLKFVMTNDNWVLSNLDRSIPIRTDAQDITNPYSYEPMLYKHSFVIESGNYTPVEMASILSDKCQTVQPNDKFTNVNQLKSPFLQSDSSLQKLYLPTTTEQIEVLSSITNSIYAFQYTKGDGSELDLPLWQGASQVSFSFDKFNKFSLDYAHTPWYSTTADSADIACSIQNYFFGITPLAGTAFTLTQHSGIAFTGLTPKSFWEGKLGFNVGEMTIFPQAGVNEAGGDGYYYPLIDFENGKNVVTGQLIQDMLIKKSTLFYQTSNLIGQVFLSDLTTPIVAPNPPFANEVNKNGYYLIEIGNKILNKFIGPNQNFNNIQSIVSTYFSLNSYTLGTSSDSIIYTHSGAPIPISSFDIRILDSNKNLAANLGNDNSIYLELIKAPKQQIPSKE